MKTLMVILVIISISLAIVKMISQMWKETNVDSLSKPLTSCLAARSSFSVLED